VWVLMNMTSLETILTPQQIVDYYQNGYVMVPGLVDSETVEFALKAIDDFIVENPDKVHYEEEAMVGRTHESLTIEERILAVRGIHQQAFRDDRFLRLVRNEQVVRALISLLGSDIKVIQDMALIKPPRIGSEKPAHQDAAYFEVGPDDQVVGTWWALDRATPENGCMYVWPGTHRLPVVEHTLTPGTPHRVISPALLDESRKIGVPMEPGDVLFFSSHLFHFTPPNRSEYRRRSLQVHYASAQCQVLPGKKARTYTLVHGESQPGGL